VLEITRSKIAETYDEAINEAISSNDSFAAIELVKEKRKILNTQTSHLAFKLKKLRSEIHGKLLSIVDDQIEKFKDSLKDQIYGLEYNDIEENIEIYEQYVRELSELKRAHFDWEVAVLVTE
jgi:hypothetical protein